jgi:hypothetical protein
MWNFRKHASAAGIVAALACSSAAQAVPTQGTFGSTSTGIININASVPSRVQITGLSDVAFTNQDPTVAASNAQNVCVFSNTAGKKYNITATGNSAGAGGGGTAFTNGGTGLTAVPYTVEWAQTSGAASGTALTSTTTLTGQASTATSPTCTGGSPVTTATLFVKMSTAALQAMQSSATYSGTLTLVVGPE